MDFGRDDYNKGIYLKDNGKDNLSIPGDEPVFLLRGHDILAPALIREWAAKLEDRIGDNRTSQSAVEQAEAMESWQSRGKLPDIP